MENQKYNFSLVAITLLGLLAASVFYFQVLPQFDSEPVPVDVKPSHYKTMRQHTGRFELKSSQVRVGNTLRDIQYYWFEPLNMEPGKKYPLTLLMHGGTGYAYSGQYLTQSAYLKRYPTFIIAPMIESTAPVNAPLWSYPVRTTNAQELTTVVSVMKSLINENPIDERRIYAFGCSLGGTGVYGASAYFDDFFAGGVAISGMWDDKKVSNMARMPLYILAGTRDTVAPVSNARNIHNKLSAVGSPVKYKEFNLEHNCPSKYFHTTDIFDWLFAQRMR